MKGGDNEGKEEDTNPVEDSGTKCGRKGSRLLFKFINKSVTGRGITEKNINTVKVVLESTKPKDIVPKVTHNQLDKMKKKYKVAIKKCGNNGIKIYLKSDMDLERY